MKVVEIFSSIQGEGYWAGKPTIFVRLAGCNKSCDFCDTDHSKFKLMGIEKISGEVQKYLLKFPYQNICITGGEPFIHEDLENLVYELSKNGVWVTIETNGVKAYKVPFAWITCSPKEPLIDYYFANELKFLIGAGMDPIWDEFKTSEKRDKFIGHTYLQPIWGASEKVNSQRLFKCMEEASKFNALVSLQIHKLVGVR